MRRIPEKYPAIKSASLLVSYLVFPDELHLSRPESAWRAIASSQCSTNRATCPVAQRKIFLLSASNPADRIYVPPRENDHANYTCPRYAAEGKSEAYPGSGSNWARDLGSGGAGARGKTVHAFEAGAGSNRAGQASLVATAPGSRGTRIGEVMPSTVAKFYPNCCQIPPFKDRITESEVAETQYTRCFCILFAFSESGSRYGSFPPASEREAGWMTP
jgi:hypothetical protein